MAVPRSGGDIDMRLQSVSNLVYQWYDLYWGLTSYIRTLTDYKKITQGQQHAAWVTLCSD